MDKSVHQEAYKSGYLDAEEGKERRPKPQFHKALLSQAYITEYVKAYQHGYNSFLLKQRREWGLEQQRESRRVDKEL